MTPQAVSSCHEPSSGPFPLWPERIVALPPLYFPPAAYYALIAACGKACVDTTLPYDKRRKETHRCVIADTRGPLELTVPIEKPDFSRKPSWADVRLSNHGQWWDKHRTALESAYGRTPYFEFYIDRLLAFFNRDTVGNYRDVASLNRAVNREICGILSIPEPVYTISEAVTPENDYRRTTFKETGSPVEYYQVRRATLGFIGGLSVLDLIFNMGPEAQRVLLETARRL